ncbi:MAG: GNAT family N-acetyltransferase [Anaerolineae bacterium]|nr:GNAT family N-acetyltransferase [Anaerolineae bacterium]
MAEIIHVRDADQAQIVQGLLREYFAWAFLVGRDELEAGSNDVREVPAFSNIDAELDDLAGVFSRERGSMLLLAAIAGEGVGCVAFQRKDAVTCELKRMYVRPAARGQGIGRELVQALIAEARSQGYRRIILDSHKSMTSAHALYEATGFIRQPIPAHFPDFVKPHIVYMELEL